MAVLDTMNRRPRQQFAGMIATRRLIRILSGRSREMNDRVGLSNWTDAPTWFVISDLSPNQISRDVRGGKGSIRTFLLFGEHAAKAQRIQSRS